MKKLWGIGCDQAGAGSSIEGRADRSTVLVTGETGTGKELAARAIHKRSRRAGSLIGLLGGRLGSRLGARRHHGGNFADPYAAGVDSGFLTEVSNTLLPGKYAVVANVSEEWVTPVDTRMEALHGFVFRTTRQSFEEAQRARDIAELRAEIDQLKVERARVSAEHKAKLQAKIDALNAKLQGKLQQAQARSEQVKRETEAKVQALQKKAAKAQGDAKAAINARVTEIKKQYEQWLGHAKSMVA